MRGVRNLGSKADGGVDLRWAWDAIVDRVSVGRPLWLILLPLVLAPLVLISLRSLSGMGRGRRAMAIGLRAAVVILLVMALAEVQAVRKNDRLATVFVVDVSESVPSEMRSKMLGFVGEAAKRRHKDDLVGVVVFGRTASVETPPSPTEPRLGLGVESTIDPQYTDLAAALKLALATFPTDTARRIVVLSDGNENRGDALKQAAAAARLGVQIDVLPVDYFYAKEVLVEKVALPSDVKKGETVAINVVVRASEPTSGTLQVFQKDSENRRVPAPGNEDPVPVKLIRGVNVFTLKQLIREANFYTFTAEFIPERGSGDRRGINNVAEGFTYARGPAQVLLIEGQRGEHAELVKALREKQIDVKVLLAPDVQGSGGIGGDALPEELSALQPYDAVILGDVAKDSLTEEQQRLLETNVHDMGAGLIMVGGPKSFGAGGWQNSPVERALPVDMQIKAMRVQGKSALVMLMHASEIAEGNYWQKVIAMEALKTLSSYDYAGMLHWEQREAWLFPVRPIGEGKATMLKAIDRMTPGDMPSFDPSLQMAANGLRGVRDAMTKHIIVISDGDPSPPTTNVVDQLIASRITVTTVLTAAHGNDAAAVRVMRDLATKTKGRFYNVTNPKALPRIYQKESRIISRPLIYEQETPWRVQVRYPTEPIAGLVGELPPITGFVQSSLKSSELAQAPIVSPIPQAGEINPVLAHWTYGLGRAVAFTPDAGRRWASAWPSWEGYAAFWSQVVRWSLRPVDSRNLALTVRREEGRLKIVVDALDQDNRFLNLLQMGASVIGPDLKPVRVPVVQVAPGRYEGTLEGAEASGNYFVNLGYSGPNDVKGIVTSGISVPYSDEYRELRSNRANLESIASLANGEVYAWRKGADGEASASRTAGDVDAFRRDPFTTPPRGFVPLWPSLLWLASVVFFADVAVRRIAPDPARIRRQIASALGRLRGKSIPAPVESIERLKGRKAEITAQLDRSHASAPRYEAPRPTGSGSAPLATDLVDGASARPAPGSNPSPPAKAAEPPPESYADRLLRAKQKVWDDRDKADREKDRRDPST